MEDTDGLIQKMNIVHHLSPNNKTILVLIYTLFAELPVRRVFVIVLSALKLAKNS